MPDRKEHWNIRVHGRVQGVCFRAYALRQARELNVNGFVRNEDDGTVYVEAEGDAKALGRLADWCRRGPPSAAVTDLDITPSAVRGYRSFEVAYSG